MRCMRLPARREPGPLCMYVYVHNAGGGCSCERVCRQRRLLQLCLAMACAPTMIFAASFADSASQNGARFQCGFWSPQQCLSQAAMPVRGLAGACKDSCEPA